MATADQTLVKCSCTATCKRGCACKKAGVICEPGGRCACISGKCTNNKDVPAQAATSSSLPRRGARGIDMARDEMERIEALQRQDEEKIENLVESMDAEEMRKKIMDMYKKYPAFVKDHLFEMPEQPEPVDEANVDWCLCGLCPQMLTNTERKCCGQSPEACVSKSATFLVMVNNAALLSLGLMIRGEYITFYREGRGAENEAFGNRCYRHAAYRHFILWQYGRLRKGQRKVIPACCVAAIRRKYPSLDGTYTGFVAGRLT